MTTQNHPIEDSIGNPHPPPPPEWQPSGLTRAEEGPIERALWARVRRVAIAQRCSLREAAEIVRWELER